MKHIHTCIRLWAIGLLPFFAYPLSAQPTLHDLVKMLLDDPGKEDSVCAALEPFSKDATLQDKSAYAAHYFFCAAMCLSRDMGRLEEAYMFGEKALYTLQTAMYTGYQGERRQRRKMQQQLQALLLDIERNRCNAPPPTQFLHVNQQNTQGAGRRDTALVLVEGLSVYVENERTPLEQYFSHRIVVDSNNHWTGIKYQEFDGGVSLSVSMEPKVFDSLFQHVHYIAETLEGYLKRSNSQVKSIEIEAEIPFDDVGIYTNERYEQGEVIYKFLWFFDSIPRELTIPTGSKLKREEILLLKMMRAGWIFRLSLEDALLLPQPEYKIVPVVQKTSRELKIHYLFHK